MNTMLNDMWKQANMFNAIGSNTLMLPVKGKGKNFGNRSHYMGPTLPIQGSVYHGSEGTNEMSG